MGFTGHGTEGAGATAVFMLDVKSRDAEAAKITEGQIGTNPLAHYKMVARCVHAAMPFDKRVTARAAVRPPSILRRYL